MSPDTPQDRRIFRVEDLTKIYRMGEVEVHALRGVDLELREVGVRRDLARATRAAASRRCLNILGVDWTRSDFDGVVIYRGWRDLTQATERSHADAATAAHHVGFVFQFYNLIPSR